MRTLLSDWQLVCIIYIFISPSGSKEKIKQLNHNINVSESTAISNQELNVNCSHATFRSWQACVRDAEKNAPQLTTLDAQITKTKLVFTDAVKDCRNPAVRTISCNLIRRKLKLRWHSTSTPEDPVRKIFMKRRVVVNSKEVCRQCLSMNVCIEYWQCLLYNLV